MEKKNPEEERSIRILLQSRLENVSLVGPAVRGICRELGFDEVAAYQLELGVVEALNNAVIHAYGRESGHELFLEIALFPKRIEFRIGDRGRAMPDFKGSELSFDSADLKACPEGGMGLCLIRQIMDETAYRSSPEGNLFTMCKDLPRKGNPSSGGSSGRSL